MADEHAESEILANMATAGIEKTIIFPYPSIYVALEKANHYTVAISRRYPDKFIPFTVIDYKPGYWLENGVKGFKEHVYGQRIQKDSNGKNIFSQEFKDTYRYMEQHGIPLLLHAGVNRVERLKQDIFKDTPGLVVILAHLGADFPESNNHRPQLEQVKTTLNALKDYPTLHFDISAIKEPDILQAGLDIVGSEKLIFGSDFPFNKPLESLQLLKSVKNLSAKDLENILYNTIIKVLLQEHGNTK
ncbi:MAG: amidohydrolase family protein [Candidatus Aminicenantes bacterium]|nr:amidohydrolase family protein [Candidatus Aminicenantes bacterium]